MKKSEIERREKQTFINILCFQFPLTIPPVVILTSQVSKTARLHMMNSSMPNLETVFIARMAPPGLACEFGM